MTTHADIVAATLAEAGVEYIFGVPGSLSSVELIEAATRRGIRYVLTSNESSAAVMAGVYGALRGRPGVLSTGVGPGAAAALHGVAHAWLERAPVLILTDRYGEAEYKGLPRQRLDQPALYAPITKASYTLTAAGAADTMRRALALTLAGRPGPVHIDLPYDLMLAEASQVPSALSLSKGEATTARAEHSWFDRLTTGGTEASPHSIEAAAAAIEAAQRPAVIVGLQVPRRGEAAEAAFAAFAEKLGVPVFASLGAKGTLPEQHALSAGVFRGVPSEKALLHQADLLLLVGFDPVEVFAPGIWLYGAPIVNIDDVPCSPEAMYRPKVEVVGDIAQALRALSARVTPHAGWNRDAIDAYRQARDEGLRRRGEGLLPGAVIRIARERLPDEGILTVDAGQHKVVTSDLWQARRARGFFSSSGLGSMAVAIPAALAAKLVEPRMPVLCFTGDGGFLMRAGDLETAVRENLPVVIVVFNDRTLNLIKLKQDERGFQRLGTSFAEVDFAALARGFGFEAATVQTEAELDAALAQALTSGRPWLIDALINPEGYV
jgi:acetolactate synthase-1/2/3 large subunit